MPAVFGFRTGLGRGQVNWDGRRGRARWGGAGGREGRRRYHLVSVGIASHQNDGLIGTRTVEGRRWM